MMRKFVEIRSYNIEPGTLAQFDQLVRQKLLPLLQKRDIEVIAFGPSLHDDASYFVMRAYASLAARAVSQDTMYASEEWKLGPREALLDLIENYTSVVIEMDAATIQALRTPT